MTQHLTYDEVYRNLSGVAALTVAAGMPLRKQRGEKDTAYVKRIVAGYITASQNDTAHNLSELLNGAGSGDQK